MRKFICLAASDQELLKTSTEKEREKALASLHLSAYSNQPNNQAEQQPQENQEEHLLLHQPWADK